MGEKRGEHDRTSLQRKERKVLQKEREEKKRRGLAAVLLRRGGTFEVKKLLVKTS